jgi:hypothetical protein
VHRHLLFNPLNEFNRTILTRIVQWRLSAIDGKSCRTNTDFAEFSGCDGKQSETEGQVNTVNVSLTAYADATK